MSELCQTVRCEVCGRVFRMITHTHLRKHNLTSSEYVRLFSGAQLVSEVGCQQRRERTSGLDAPWHKPEFQFQKGEKNVAKRPEVRKKLREQGVGRRPDVIAKRVKKWKKLCAEGKIEGLFQPGEDNTAKRPEVRAEISRKAKLWVRDEECCNNMSTSSKRWCEEHPEEAAAKAAHAREFLVPQSSSIERKLIALLEEMGVEVKTQMVIPGLRGPVAAHRCDVVVPQFHLILEADGCYWHSCPVCCPDALKVCHIAQGVKRDREFEEAVSETQWRILRFWEHEINSDLLSIRIRIQKEMEVAHAV